MITAVVLTKDEERHIGACLDALAWCERRAIVDNFSSDQTVAIARACSARVIEHAFVDFAAQRNSALETVEDEWIFFVDADERATPALGREIMAAINAAPAAIAGYAVPRQNYLFGRLTRGAGYWPDYQTRVLRRGRARYEGAASEVAVLDGDTGYLKSPLIHYNYDSPAHFHRKQLAREDFEVRNLYRQGVRPRAYTPYSMFVRHFWWRFVTLKGYQDGLHGLRLSWLLAYYFGYRYYDQLARFLRGA